MLGSLRFRLPALFLVGILLAGLIAALISIRFFQSYNRARAVDELRSESVGIVQLYARQAGVEAVPYKGLVKALGGDKVYWAPAFNGATLLQNIQNVPKNALSRVSEVKIPVLGLYGEADAGIKVEQIKDMEAKLKAAGKTAEFKIYPGAPHGFHADYRPSYRKEAAEDGWKRLQAWFKKYGVA